MRYWKGLIGTNKEGVFGTMDDLGFVPDSEEVTQAEYDIYIASLPVPEVKKTLSELLRDKGVISPAEFDSIVR